MSRPSVLSGWCRDEEPDQQAMLAAIGRAASSDWRAAAWWLERHPATSGTYSTAAVEGRLKRSVVATVINAISAAALSPTDEQRLLLQLQAHLGADAAEAME
jgi:hypothetical protein